MNTALLAVDRHLAPTTLVQALAALSGEGGTTILAGGTDLMPQSRAGRIRPARTLLSLRRVPDLDGVAVESGDTLALGALVSVTTLLGSPLVRELAPLVADAAGHFASEQIRNAATLGGNLCNASPASDLATPLFALDAEVELASLGEAGAIRKRCLPIAEFFTGPGRTTRAADELLTAVRLRLAPPDQRHAFYKGGTRPGLDISTISIAIAARRDDAGALSTVRVALGAVGPTPLRARRTEALLEGKAPDAALIEQAAGCAAEEATPIDDVRASAWYRRELVMNMTRRMLTDVCHP
ncbi:MAG TPA: xanthine dehydrogenase family protein subunit M [Burkholderiaceae bacterium]|nr:xanthine dehydrogenase family protein subunit M [Burkholderiaceae bacterium]